MYFIVRCQTLPGRISQPVPILYKQASPDRVNVDTVPMASQAHPDAFLCDIVFCGFRRPNTSSRNRHILAALPLNSSDVERLSSLDFHPSLALHRSAPPALPPQHSHLVLMPVVRIPDAAHALILAEDLAGGVADGGAAGAAQQLRLGQDLLRLEVAHADGAFAAVDIVRAQQRVLVRPRRHGHLHARVRAREGRQAGLEEVAARRREWLDRCMLLVETGERFWRRNLEVDRIVVRVQGCEEMSRARLTSCHGCCHRSRSSGSRSACTGG